MIVEEWSQPDMLMASEACLQGCGGVCGQFYFHCPFPPGIVDKDLSISELELLAIVVCLKLWHNKLIGKKVMIFCDNMASVMVLNRGASRNCYMQACLREVCWLAAHSQFEIRARHISGVDNRVPDMLSRWSLADSYKQQFQELTKTEQLKECLVFPKMFVFSHDW